MASNMADAVTYLSNVASAAGFFVIASDLLAVRDKLTLIAEVETESPLEIQSNQRKHDAPDIV
jgi:hypothetical protein